MANPSIVACPTGVWTIVATNVVTGNIHRLKTISKYLQTYRLTGESAPVNLSEAVPMFEGPDKRIEQIQSNQAIDVYIWCKRVAGSVRVDV